MFSSPSCFSVATLVLFITFLTAPLTLTGAATLGVAYGTLGDNLPRPREVVELYKLQGIKSMRIYDPNQEVMEALRGSDIELLLGVPNTDLQQLATGSSYATRWVRSNVLNYLPDVTIKYIAVGNEVSPVTKNGNSKYAPFLFPAMTNIFNAVKDAGLFQKVGVSTSLDTSVIGTSYPPSAGVFRSDLLEFINPIIRLLTETRALIMFNIYPYFAYLDNPRDIKLSYALFTNESPEFTDNGLTYYNHFDAMVDGVYSALEKASGSSLKVVVSESGWPSNGRPERGPTDAPSILNACTYNQNLFRHITSSKGTPKKPGAPIETYMFAMFNENSKSGAETEKYFGLFYPNKQPVCRINFHET